MTAAILTDVFGFAEIGREGPIRRLRASGGIGGVVDVHAAGGFLPGALAVVTGLLFGYVTCVVWPPAVSLTSIPLLVITGTVRPACWNAWMTPEVNGPAVMTPVTCCGWVLR